MVSKIEQRLKNDSMVKILKRDGVSVVEYNSNKIINVIKKAMLEDSQLGYNEEIAAKIEQEIYDELLYQNELSSSMMTVENVQDLVEDGLLRYDRKKTAKDYIRFRDKRSEDRKSEKYGILSKEFLSKYKHMKPPMTQLGEFVYYRTYSRFLDEKGRRETWFETVRRAVEYNCGLVNTPKDEAEELFDNIFNLRQFLSGRTFWMGGTDVSKYYPMANYNCSFQIIDDIESFRDIFYVLLIGSGAGIRVRKSDVDKLPPFRSGVRVLHLDFSPVPKKDRNDSTSLQFEGNMAEIVVGDSKEGWVQALDYYMKLVTSFEYREIKDIIFNYNHVRPQGEKLKTFGGTASGSTALLGIFKKIEKVISRVDGIHKLKPIDCLDIANQVGEGVVVGGVRRTAEIILLDDDDNESIDAKSNLYKQVDGQWVVDKEIIHRQMSNNSIYYTEKPSRERLHWQIERMRYSGEPAWVNAEAGAKRRDNFNGVNPCGEILLDNKGLCNLTTVNVFAFVDEDSKLKKDSLLKAQRLSARAGYRMTCVELELPKWNLVQQRDKLIGCSLTGWQDMVNATGMDMEEQSSLLREMRDVATNESNNLADTLHQNRPLLACTVKPEGSLSQLPTVSSGVHYSHSPYYIRRVRINSDDPLVNVVEDLGYPIKPEVGYTMDNCKTKVVEFPVKAPNGKTKYNASAIDQLENYIMFQENYTQHNTSITVHVRNHEWEEVEEWVWQHWDDIMAVSFLSLDDSFYELLPYEAIEEDEYLKRLNSVEGKTITPDKISKYEREEIQLDIGSDGCDTGVCPIR